VTSAVPRIRIHPPSSGRTTDVDAAGAIAAACPSAFRKAQDVLVAADKYAHKKGWFSSEASRIKRLQSTLYDLNKALEDDDYRSSDRAQIGTVAVLFLFFSEFSDAFPNWQDEYAALEKFIPLCF